VGPGVGSLVGMGVEFPVGSLVRSLVGAGVGSLVGEDVGLGVGPFVRVVVGFGVGSLVGSFVGAGVGLRVGKGVGTTGISSSLVGFRVGLFDRMTSSSQGPSSSPFTVIVMVAMSHLFRSSHAR